MIIEVLNALSLLLTAPMIAYLVRHFIFTLTVLNNGCNSKKVVTREKAPYQPTVSILIPARNEERVIARILQRMSELTYPKDKTQVIVIDDASSDDTRRITDEYAKRYDHIEVMHRSPKEGGVRKASALNAALKRANGEIVVCLDADYYPQVDITEKIVSGFVDQKVGGVQGRVTVLNEPQNLVTRLVALERMGGYRVDMQARDDLGLLVQVGGTVNAVRRSLLESLGGWNDESLTEDTDLTFRIYLAGYKIRYLIDAESYEEAVENLRGYWRQRYRWAKGHMQCAFKYSIPVLKSKNLKIKEKIDGLLLLSIYFMPILVLLSWIVGVSLFLLKPSQVFSVFWASSAISLYSFVGNFAPFFEVGIGAYLDGRTRAYWLIPLLIFTFLLNIAICTKAFTDLLISKISRKNCNHWDKTVHCGSGNSYIAK